MRWLTTAVGITAPVSILTEGRMLDLTSSAMVLATSMEVNGSGTIELASSSRSRERLQVGISMHNPCHYADRDNCI